MINEKLKTLIALDKVKSYTKAAQICNLTQPAITQHIKALEDQYNIQIFQRVKGKLITTQDGKILIKNAKRLLAMNKNIDKELFLSKTNHRKLDIGITPTASYYLIPEILNLFREKHPNILFNFHTDTVENITERLKYLELDFAIVDGGISHPTFTSIKLVKDEIILIAPADHPFTKLNEITWDMLKNEKLILRHKTAHTRRTVENILLNNGDSIDNYEVILELDNTSLIRHLVRDGHGLSFTSKSICLEDLDNGYIKEVKIKDFHLERDVYIVHQKKFQGDPLINDILSLGDSE